MTKILSFGELLLRICPDGDGVWLEENKLPFYVGGAELNVASALALWGIPSAYFTALPKNYMTEQLVGHLDSLHIDTSRIRYEGDRVGLYYLSKGKDLKNAGVIYDRAHSSFSNIKPGSINWDLAFDGVSWFHFSAICPALNQAAADVCLEAVKAARQKGITISIDLNYRAKLWQYGKQPVEIVPELVSYCDVVMGNIWAAQNMLGFSVPEYISESSDKAEFIKASKETSEVLISRYPQCNAVANTFRFDQNKGINYYTTLYTNQQLYTSKEYSSDQILDKVGSGDCYMAGLIYGFCQQNEPQQVLEFATAAAFKKLFIPSDCTTSTVADINQTILTHS